MSIRSEKVAETIKREISDIIRNHVKDIRVQSPLISITNVEVTGDLKHAKIFISIYENSEKQQQIMIGLNSALGYIRSELARRIRLRFIPELHFKLDRSIEKGSKVIALIDKITKERQTKNGST